MATYWNAREEAEYEARDHLPSATVFRVRTADGEVCDFDSRLSDAIEMAVYLSHERECVAYIDRQRGDEDAPWVTIRSVDVNVHNVDPEVR